MEKYATQLGNDVKAYHGDIVLIAVDPDIYLIVILEKTLYQNDAILLFNVPAEIKPLQWPPGRRLEETPHIQAAARKLGTQSIVGFQE